MKEFDLIVLGSGPGGYVASIRAAQLGMRVACVDKRSLLGGTCLHEGCIPSKTLLHASENVWHFGLDVGDTFKRKHKVISSLQEGISALFKKNRITTIFGEGSVRSAHSVAVNGEEYQAQHILLATGSEPIALPFLPFDEKTVLSSTGALALDKAPKTLLVVGAGVIGVELGSVFSRLGTRVSYVEFLDRVCPTFDVHISKAFQELLVKQGMEFHLSSRVIGAQVLENGVSLQVVDASGDEKVMHAEKVLVCIGRRPLTRGLGLENVNIKLDSKGFIPIDGAFRTVVPSIYAIGDLVDGPMLAHKASEEGTAVAELLAGHTVSINYTLIPQVVYTYPEVASVGFSEEEAKHHGFEVRTAQAPFKANPRAKCTGEEEGFVKVVADSVTDRVLGVQILGAHASELIQEAVIAIRYKATALSLGQTPCAHPTLSETLKEAALAIHGRAIHR